MEYQEFKDTLKSLLQDSLSEKPAYRVEIIDLPQVGDTLIVSEKGSKSASGISLQKLYQYTVKEQKDIQEAVDMVREVMETVLTQVPVMEKLGEINLTDNPSIRDMLTVELERAEGNGAFLAEGLYERQALGALVPYIQTEIDGKICRTRITPKLLKGYGMSREAVMKQAMDNVQKKNPARLFRMGASEGLSYFIVSGKDREGGATAALYPGMLDELRRKIGEDYYVVPTSKGEVVAMGKSEGVSLDILQKFLVERNRTQEPSQILSSRIFEYKDDEKQLSVCRPDRNRDMGR